MISTEGSAGRCAWNSGPEWQLTASTVCCTLDELQLMQKYSSSWHLVDQALVSMVVLACQRLLSQIVE